ncbi:cobalamin biosynthesis protein [Actinosynnema pretiosum subsp. pretiosum]|uniref:Cobalamin biosynthesis protein CobD n=2 Tax=Actinosynnema TaxID=40566 RepID=C6WM99_ACTMD|nr:cobalamin biosynthesis protein [Actinosynnema mirum]ACU34833.1 cobalamin biosynthesis protein CobD [Actinosynnema mirum DSM 43827]AXX28198.1 Adenosylcobinamide-phosphate synthase [Actinosynnema pretiosum subsp. pretiosum]QUF07428.1 cobalamin biosynthesis protein [Actinosynnema pretiosum subsp. pretiosum]
MSLGRAVGLALGVAADAVFGDPRRGHPVAAFGRVAGALEQRLHRDDKGAGAAHVVVLVGGVVLAGAAVERLAGRSEALRALTTAAATWVVLGGASLADEGTAMGRELDGGDLVAARDRLPNLCGRDPERLDTMGLAKATVESVAENTSDAVVAPLVWGAVAGVPGLLGYRAVNTLDAMIGHRSARYRNFGWAAARLDDLANLLPSRLAALLTVAGAPVVGGSAGEAWQVWRRDAAAHPSPNAGQVEAAFAGALEIQLGGRTVYSYGPEDRPVLGHGRNPDAGHVTRAVELSRVVGAGAAAVSALVAVLVRRKRRG